MSTEKIQNFKLQYYGQNLTDNKSFLLSDWYVYILYITTFMALHNAQIQWPFMCNHYHKVLT